MKKDNENFFDIDFKQDKVKSSEKKQDNDFFDFSMKPDKRVSEDISPAIDSTDAAEETQTELAVEIAEEIAEDVTADVTENVVDDSALEVQEESNDDVIIETSDFSPAVNESTEIQAESQEEVQEKVQEKVQETVSPETTEENDDDVIINVVSWGKVAPESQVKTVEPKKSNLVIDLEDGFEIKMCNFRELSQKENNPKKNIKKN